MSKGDVTRANLLDVAVGLASEEGLVGVTIGRLAEKAGMSKSGLFAHFSSRANLEVEILTTAAARFLDHVVLPALKARRGEPRVTALFERWLGWPDAFPGGCVFAAASVELDDRDGEARATLVRLQRDWLETLATAARGAVTEGHFRADLDPEQLAHDAYCLGLGHFLFARLLRDPRNEERVRRAFQRLLVDARPPIERI